DLTFTFRSLFSLKTPTEESYTAWQDSNSVYIQSTTGPIKQKTQLVIPGYSATENIIPVILKTEHDASGNRIVTLTVATPELFVNGKKVWGYSFTNQLFVLPIVSAPLTLNINGVVNFKLPTQ